mgnify:CR=1 FL=1
MSNLDENKTGNLAGSDISSKNKQDTNPEKAKKPFYKEPMVLAAMGLILLALIFVAVWVIKSRNDKLNELASATPTHDNHATPFVKKVTSPPTVPPTEMPTVEIVATPEPRTEVITYIIQEGETLIDIAEKFGIWPDTILWANRYELGTEVRDYTAGKQIFILPVNGAYHKWHEGEGLNGVAKYYNVTADDIIDYPGNKLDRSTLGSTSSPNIPAGTRLVVPGGTISDYFADDALLYYAAVKKIRSLPLGTPETHPEPRQELIAYKAQESDSIFSIAESFGLEPETVLWANRYIIGDTPDGISPGQLLMILPEDGVLHAWSYGEGLNAVSRAYGVSPEEILAEPMNQVDKEEIGDFSLPSIATGTFFYIPGGKGSTPNWVSYVSVPNDPSLRRANVSYLGAFSCYSSSTLQGSGSWQLPTGSKYISGYEYNPPVHNGLDYGGKPGTPLMAADSGVIIYAGWSDRGYGNTVVIDHLNGYISLYAHILDGGINVLCGQAVYGGTVIGYMGSTGKSTGAHLHFEIRYNGSPVNPHSFGL